MTLHEYLQRRNKNGFMVGAAFAIPAWICGIVAPKGSLLEFIGIAVFLVTIFIVTVWLGRTPCPRCGKPLGMVAQQRQRFGERLLRTDRCRNCGFGVDEQIPGSAKF
jgi:predicted RNA-binding Zn-ribbon protein involved in translation (DUF1610 family)